MRFQYRPRFGRSLDEELLILADELEIHVALGGGPGASLAHLVLAASATDLIEAVRASQGLVKSEGSNVR
jgi:hypothetical protein